MIWSISSGFEWMWLRVLVVYMKSSMRVHVRTCVYRVYDEEFNTPVYHSLHVHVHVHVCVSVSVCVFV